MALPNGLPQVSDLGSILDSTVDAFQSPELISAPATQITDMSGAPRKLYDPSKTLTPSLGVEPIVGHSLKWVRNERGPNGEPVYSFDTKDPRVRFVGGGWYTENDVLGPMMLTPTVNDFVEVTFYGTTLNLLTLVDATARDLRATIDGGAEGPDFYIEGNAILNSRLYRNNQIIKVNPTPLSLGVHTIKIRLVSGSNMRIYGFEVLNESSQIKVPQGNIYNGGTLYSNTALQSINYNSGFDGNPTLNGRGGRVVEYLSPNGTVGKVIQQTNSASAFLTSADHTNESVINTINWRYFGAHRSDDFSTAAAATSDRWFTLGNNTTSLVGNDVTTVTNTVNQIDGIGPNSSSGYLIFTFNGTGFDIVNNRNATLTTNYDITVDGVAIATNQSGASLFGAGNMNIVKIASGLPYGSHTVKISVNGAIGTGLTISDFIVYGPKEPAIPAGAIKLQEYYLVAIYSGTTGTGSAPADMLKIPTGVIYKSTFREFVYTGSGWSVGDGGVFANGYFRSGNFVSTTAQNDYWEYVFWGTGFVVEGSSNTGGATAYTVQVDGVLNATGVPLTTGTTNTGGGGYSVALAAGVPARVEFTGLTLGRHTVRVTRTTASGLSALSMSSGIHVITPIHYPDLNIGNRSMGSGVQFLKDVEANKVAQNRAKVLVAYDGVNNTLNNSMNVTTVTRTQAGIYVVYFKKPFKSQDYIVTGSTKNGAVGQDPLQFDVLDQQRGWVRIGTSYNSGAGSGNDYDRDTRLVTMACFGELEDEE